MIAFPVDIVVDTTVFAALLLVICNNACLLKLCQGVSITSTGLDICPLRLGLQDYCCVHSQSAHAHHFTQLLETYRYSFRQGLCEEKRQLRAQLRRGGNCFRTRAGFFGEVSSRRQCHRDGSDEGTGGPERCAGSVEAQFTPVRYDTYANFALLFSFYRARSGTIALFGGVVGGIFHSSHLCSVLRALQSCYMCFFDAKVAAGFVLQFTSVKPQLSTHKISLPLYIRAKSSTPRCHKSLARSSAERKSQAFGGVGLRRTRYPCSHAFCPCA